MLTIEPTKNFKKDAKKLDKSSQNDISKALRLLQKQERLPNKYHDYKLVNCKEYMNCRECHVRPDLLLVYRIHGDRLVLELVRVGSHSKLFSESRINHVFETV